MRSLLNCLATGAVSIVFYINSIAQSIHQEELESHNSTGLISTSDYESSHGFQAPEIQKSDCNLNKMVYGWHPYWVGNVYQNYRWDLLSHLSFFSYEVDYTNGNALSTHGWSTSAAVNTALSTGSTKVTLCVTLFSNHTAFLTNSTAKQNLITNLISLISARGAHGVNIDFEGLPSSQATNFANFMVDLSNQMHTAIPGSEVSTVLYSVDWNSVFNFSIMEPEVDYYIIMGYDYYYSGSTTAGPNDPLYQFGSSYNYTLSRSITDYLKAGCPKNKLIMGLPSYGREWSTSSLTLPSATTATGVSRTYSYIQNNSSGFYTTANHNYEAESESDVYLFTNGTTPKQCFITEENAFEKRLDHVLNTGIGGIGIWALGYDEGYDELWNAIESKLTACQQDPCTGIIHDFGGPSKNYYNNENYTWTISPENANSLDISFSVFDIENNYDFLYIYDGNSTASPQIPGSPFTGTVSPGTFSTTTGSITFKFTSDVSTVKPGFIAMYTCNQDDIDPVSVIPSIDDWQTADFTVNFQDSDNNSVSNRYSLITDFNGIKRTANKNLGYLFEDFDLDLTNQWTTGLGSWAINSGWALQTNETEANTALNSMLSQDNGGIVLYQWKGKIGGAGTNRRAGLHFFCSDLSLPNKGNSYLVYWRVDSDKCQIYRSTTDNLVLQTNDDVVIEPNVEYDFLIKYNPSSGLIEAYLDGVLVSSWLDPSPINNGNGISFRSGNSTWSVNDLNVFKQRNANQTITLGPSNLVRYENPSSDISSCQIFSVIEDNAGNFSQETNELVNIDWTPPSTVNVNDGLGSDVDVFVNPNEISANWTGSTDLNSEIDHYEVGIGITPGTQNIVSFTNVGTLLNKTFTGLNLTLGQTYYFTVKAMNGAGLESVVSNSNGQILQTPTNPPIANFQNESSLICFGDSIQLINTSTDGVTYFWSSDQGIIQNPSSQDTYLKPLSSGVYNVTLSATNSAGSNQITIPLNITVQAGPIAIADPDNDLLSMPNAIVLFSNSSQNSDSYFWDFGDGEQSVDENPWHQYSSTGTFNVMMVAHRDGCLNDTTFNLIVVGNAGVFNISEDKFRLYPNPSNGIFTIKSEAIEKAEIYDLNGKLVFESEYPSSDKIELNLKNSLNAGFYFLKIKSDNTVKNLRVTVVKD